MIFASIWNFHHRTLVSLGVLSYTGMHHKALTTSDVCENIQKETLKISILRYSSRLLYSTALAAHVHKVEGGNLQIARQECNQVVTSLGLKF